MSSKIRNLSDQIARVKAGVDLRVEDVSIKLGIAETNFHKAADGTEAYVGSVVAYTAELQSMTAELTNGSEPLDADTTFPVAVPAVGSPAAMLHGVPVSGRAAAMLHGVPVSGRAAVIATQHELGREHNPA